VSNRSNPADYVVNERFFWLLDRRGQIVTATQTGNLTADDAKAIATFLQSVTPVSNKVPGPFKPGEKVSTFMFRIMPPGETAAAAPK